MKVVLEGQHLVEKRQGRVLEIGRKLQILVQAEILSFNFRNQVNRLLVLREVDVDKCHQEIRKEIKVEGQLIRKSRRVHKLKENQSREEKQQAKKM